MTVKEPVGAGSALQVWLQLDQAGLQCRSSNLNPDCTPVTRQNMTETLNGKKTITYIVPETTKKAQAGSISDRGLRQLGNSTKYNRAIHAIAHMEYPYKSDNNTSMNPEGNSYMHCKQIRVGELVN